MDVFLLGKWGREVGNLYYSLVLTVIMESLLWIFSKKRRKQAVQAKATYIQLFYAKICPTLTGSGGVDVTYASICDPAKISRDLSRVFFVKLEISDTLCRKGSEKQERGGRERRAEAFPADI